MRTGAVRPVCRRRRGYGLRAVAALALSALSAGKVQAQGAEAPKPIADNSFLIEEAYNQDPGVVQHINTFSKAVGSDAWAYTYTQEWPLFSQAHQIGFTLAVLRQGQPGIGDLAVNYRYQLVGPAGKVAVAPRLTITAPTGNAARGLGAGSVGFQANVPVSVMVSSRFVTHANAGVTLTPNASDGTGNRASTTSVNLGASVVWLVRAHFNVLLEGVCYRTEQVSGPNATAEDTQILLSPGIRWAHDLPGGVQVVPGVAYSVDLRGNGNDALFLYLSIEHPFRRTHRSSSGGT